MIPGIFQLRSVSENKQVIYATIELTFFALNKETGEVIWQHELGSYSIFLFQQMFDEKMVYILDNESNVLGLEKFSGEVLWKYPVDPKVFDNGWVFIVGDTLYLQSFHDKEKDNLLSLNTQSGKQNWQTTIRNIGYLPPVAFGEMLYFVRMDDWGQDVYLTALDTETGEIIRETKIINEVYDHVNLQATGNKLYIDLKTILEHKEHNVLFVVDMNTAEILWSFNQDLTFHDITYTESGDTVYIGVEEKQLLALSADTGEIEWQIEIPTFPTYLLTEQETILAFSEDGIVNAYNTTSGSLLWAKDLDVHLSIYGVEDFDAANQTAQIVSGKLYIAGDAPYLQIVDIKTGDILWKWSHTPGFEKVPGANYALSLFDEDSIFVFGGTSAYSLSRIIKAPLP